MKCAIKRKGFCPHAIEQLVAASGHTIWAVVCLANESCAIGDEYPSTLRNFLIREFRKYAQIYGVSINFQTGEIIPRSSINRCYANRHTDEVQEPAICQEILVQLERRLWRYLELTQLTLWIDGLEDII
ncbi:hypothetical protein FWG86_02215 [Candidatus Saccharibacteria bacterium]|nr:hypothetical protein [Candidatus Saccharibacteria bacterium]